MVDTTTSLRLPPAGVSYYIKNLPPGASPRFIDLEFVHMTTCELQVHVLSCVLFGGSHVTVVVLVLWFKCAFLLSKVLEVLYANLNPQ